MKRITNFFLAGSIWGLAGALIYGAWVWHDTSVNGTVVFQDQWVVDVVDDRTMAINCYNFMTRSFHGGQVESIQVYKTEPSYCGMTPKDWTEIINLPSEAYAKCQRSAPLEIKCTEPINLFEVIMEESS